MPHELDPRFRFDNLVVGPANRLAVAAARAVAQSPGMAYNPLFIYGGPGLGKTHLLVAVGHLAVQVQPDIRLRYVTLEALIDELHAAVAGGQLSEFKARYRDVELLLLDDVQYVAGRPEAQKEILGLFNTLQRKGSQIVLASERAPGELADLDEQLVARLAGGLNVDVDVPDGETRVAILKRKCQERQAQFDGGVIEALARLDFENVRELEAALTRLIAFQSLGGGVVVPENVRAVVGAPEEPVIIAPPADEFGSFLSDIAAAVAEHIDSWRARLGDAVAKWRAEGYRTAMLERALGASEAPDVDLLLVAFEVAVVRLRELEGLVADVNPSLAGAEQFRDPERVADAERFAEQVLATADPPPAPATSYTRANFEVSGANQFAVAAADAVVTEPGRRHNPLVIHGMSGVGKTHLAHAIANAFLEATAGAARVACLDAELFVDELNTALRDGKIERWRARYRAVDMLVLDDVQALAGKERTQEELFHLFNALHATGKQIVVTSDRAPRALGALEERLRSRFESGLLVELSPPDRALCDQLYRRAFAPHENRVPPEVVADLAGRGAASAREVLATAARVARLAERGGTPVTLAQVRRELGAAPMRAPTPLAMAAIASNSLPTQRPLDPYFLGRENVVWEWPQLEGRMIEEVR